MPTKLDPIFNHGRAVGRGGGLKREGHGRSADVGHGGGHGRSEWSPGHLKREDDARSARDYSPGHTDESEWARRGGRDTVMPEVAPDEMAED